MQVENLREIAGYVFGEVQFNVERGMALGK